MCRAPLPSPAAIRAVAGAAAAVAATTEPLQKPLTPWRTGAHFSLSLPWSDGLMDCIMRPKWCICKVHLMLWVVISGLPSGIIDGRRLRAGGWREAHAGMAPQHSTPKWALVGGCRCCKLAHTLTCTPWPVACQRAMAVHAVHSGAGTT